MTNDQLVLEGEQFTTALASPIYVTWISGLPFALATALSRDSASGKDAINVCAISVSKELSSLSNDQWIQSYNSKSCLSIHTCKDDEDQVQVTK
jgi:hypothetical protein